MEPWALQGSFFAIFGSLGRMSFVYPIWERQKVGQKTHPEAQKRNWPEELGRPGGMRLGTGEGTLGEGAENFAENLA